MQRQQALQAAFNILNRNALSAKTRAKETVGASGGNQEIGFCDFRVRSARPAHSSSAEPAIGPSATVFRTS